MSETVKGKRPYDSRRRRAQAEQTRLDILAAAAELFTERGYPATTLAAVAASAEVVVETIYRAFGNKAGLFREVVRAAVAGGGDRAKVDPERRPAIQAVIEETDPRRKLALYARTQPGIHRRSGPLLRALAVAAATDPALAELATQIEDERRAGLQRFAAHLAERGMLRPGLSIDEAGDTLWMINALTVYDLLVTQRGWTLERYRDWLADTLHRLLIADLSELSSPMTQLSSDKSAEELPGSRRGAGADHEDDLAEQ
ncbi:TetR/AcrR family transcriptional regulator [Microlunatus speluncae]|uniref:TetR/AcrR family transcriptional regulator n=1 Tax=Microlunatus speluncae TaxID=2594267 RepID=UPI001266392E|nr:TetR family transcriptional regulator [Microlunatus speluncae]